METGKNKTSTKNDITPLKVVDVTNDSARVEREIEKNINKIRSLISKLRPSERQKYFDGLLSHLLSEPVEVKARMTPVSRNQDSGRELSNLSFEEIQLIEELSIKIEQLYRTMDHDPS